MAARRIKSLVGIPGQRAHREHRADKNRKPGIKASKERRRMLQEFSEKWDRRHKECLY